MDFNRLRRQVSFDRLLARLFRDAAPPWFLKGGYALELRYKAARSTVDIDLTVQGIAVSAAEDQNQIVREMLQHAADVSLGDWFEFTYGAPIMDLTVAPYGGARYPVEARMDERIFARFHLDAGVGDVVSPPVDAIVCRDWLDRAGIPTAQAQMIAREQQFAEKVHPYTLPARSEKQSEGPTVFVPLQRNAVYPPRSQRCCGGAAVSRRSKSRVPSPVNVG